MTCWVTRMSFPQTDTGVYDDGHLLFRLYTILLQHITLRHARLHPFAPPLPRNLLQPAHQRWLVPRVERLDVVQIAAGVPDILRTRLIQIRALNIVVPQQVTKDQPQLQVRQVLSDAAPRSQGEGLAGLGLVLGVSTGLV